MRRTILLVLQQVAKCEQKSTSLNTSAFIVILPSAVTSSINNRDPVCLAAINANAKTLCLTEGGTLQIMSCSSSLSRLFSFISVHPLPELGRSLFFFFFLFFFLNKFWYGLPVLEYCRWFAPCKFSLFIIIKVYLNGLTLTVIYF